MRRPYNDAEQASRLCIGIEDLENIKKAALVNTVEDHSYKTPSGRTIPSYSGITQISMHGIDYKVIGHAHFGHSDAPVYTGWIEVREVRDDN